MALEPKHVIAESFMRRDAFMPSKETLAKAEYAITMLEEAGWRIVKAGEFMRVTPPKRLVFRHPPGSAGMVEG